MPAELTQSQIHEFQRKKVNYRNIFQPKGCEQCDGTGYNSRIAIYDLLIFSDTIKANIASSEAMIAQLRNDGNKKGMSNMHKQGMKTVVSGISSLEELKRVVG